MIFSGGLDGVVKIWQSEQIDQKFSSTKSLTHENQKQIQTMILAGSEKLVVGAGNEIVVYY